MAVTYDTMIRVENARDGGNGGRYVGVTVIWVGRRGERAAAVTKIGGGHSELGTQSLTPAHASSLGEKVTVRIGMVVRG